MPAEPRSCYLVCATQRSGSTLLCQLLGQTGVAGRPEEYFEAERDTGAPPHPGRFLQGAPGTGLGLRDDPTAPVAPAYSSLAGIADYRDHLVRTFRAGTTENGVFGAKLMFNQLAELHALATAMPDHAGLDEGELLRRLFGDPRYIWVTRADKVRQAVSLWKALQNRRWRSGDVGGADPVALEYRFSAIDHLVRWFESADAGWRAHFARYGIEPLRVRYEDDLERDPERTLRVALDWIGVPAPAHEEPRRATGRQADALSEEWVRTYHRERARQGSSTAGPSTASS